MADKIRHQIAINLRKPGWRCAPAGRSAGRSDQRFPAYLRITRIHCAEQMATWACAILRTQVTPTSQRLEQRGKTMAAYDPFDAVSTSYLRAGLRLGQEIDGLVDSYYGPEELRQDAAQLGVERALDELDTEIARLTPDARRDYLTAQSRALRAIADLHSGKSLPYRDEIEATFGVRPELVDEAQFETALEELDRLLPGDGDLYTRRQDHRAQLVIEPSAVLPLTQTLMSDLRERAESVVQLPAGEAAHIEIVHDQPWSGYNWYLGNLRSRIEINADLPIHANSLPDLIAHEIYCGHHTEHSVKEQRFVREQGWGEAAITLLTSPQAVVSEGIATMAFETLVPEEDEAAWLRRHCYAAAGIDLDVELELAIQRAARPLRYVSGNAALLIHDEGQPLDAAREYITRYGLRSPAEAEQTVRFITTPILRCYTFTYTEGYDRVSAFLARSGDPHRALGKLITGHWSPERLTNDH